MRTFDVFETVLVRRVGLPQSVFLLLGAQPEVRRITGLGPGSFADLRTWCERDQRRTHPSREISLDQIYRALGRDLGLSADDLTLLVEAELALEGRLLSPSPLHHDAVADARRAHGKVFWLSDTYVPSSWLVTQLQRHGLWADGDAVYVSNEHLASKVLGDLYPLVAREAGVEAAKFEHTGNDAAADVAQARAAGWRATLAPEANPNRHELALEERAPTSSGLSSLVAGASILTRVERCAGDHARWRVAAAVGGPAIAGFALWLLLRAAELNLGRIYFVARDGELPLRLVRTLQPFVPGAEAIELRYLYGSRQAWHLPAADLEPERVAGWLRARAWEASANELLARLRLTPDDVAPLMAVGDPDKPLGPAADHLLDELLAHDRFWARVAAAAEPARETLLGYLRQEGLLESDAYACVELGWHGRAARSLQLVLESAGHSGPARYQFFGLYSAPGAGGAPKNAEAFLRDFREGGKVSEAYQYFVEAFCAGLEGRTAEIVAAGDRYEPVLAEPSNEAAIEWGLEEVYAAIERFAENLALGLEAAPETVTKPNVLALRPAIDAIIETAWAVPEPEEAGVLGAIPLRRSLVHEGWQTLARPLGWRDVPVAFRRVPRHAGMGWEAGSMALTGRTVRKLVAGGWRARARLARALRR